MSLRTFVSLFALFCLSYAATLPLSIHQVPEQLKEVVPEEVKKFYADLTEEDKTILKEVAANHASYENEDQAMEALKAKSEKLFNKATELRTLLKTKIDSLKPDAKAFVEGIINKVRALKPKGEEKPDLKKIREVANEVIDSYKALGEESKQNLQETFPQITNVIKNEKFQTLAQGLIKQEN
uniref:Fatty-acid and retinol-binding protein n=1 Tax=Aphelenchoides ritzemabosi TaxID=409481 RepID=A0A2D0WIZ9_9BILA|nr:fatty-acid and retinol-binding protein [Aphelenchoides ritzemabosi]